MKYYSVRLTKQYFTGFTPLSEEEEHIAKEIVDAAHTVHKALGPGLLEKVYEVCFLINFNVPLIKKGIKRII